MSRKRLLLVCLSVLVLSVFRPVARADDPEGVLVPAVSLDGNGEIEPCFTGCTKVIVAAVNANYEQQVVELTNAERAKVGLPPLKRITTLDDASRYHALDMRDDDYFMHDSYDRSDSDLVLACGWSTRIGNFYSGWNTLSENSAAGYSTPEAAMNGWMNSSGHKANILRANSCEIGVGYYTGGSWGRYWVQDFGCRTGSGVYPLVINREAASTDSKNVQLYIYGTWSEIRLKNDDGTWSAWMPFSNEMAWTLSSGTGTHTVYAEMRKTGASASSSDTIWLDDVTPILGNLPASMGFYYSIPDQRFLSAPPYVLTPKNTNTDQVLTWNLTQSGSWFSLSASSGTTPNSVTVTPDAFDKYTVATHNGSITVTVTFPSGVDGSPHTIDLTMYVVDRRFYDAFLPLVLGNSQ